MPANVVCNGAMCQCNQGNVETPLTVSNQQVFRIDGQLVATIQDNVPDANIKPFGTCNLLTRQAAETPTPCLPVLTGPWAPGAAVAFAMNLPVLTSQSKLACTVGGEVTIASSNCTVDCNVQ